MPTVNYLQKFWSTKVLMLEPWLGTFSLVASLRYVAIGTNKWFAGIRCSLSTE